MLKIVDDLKKAYRMTAFIGFFMTAGLLIYTIPVYRAEKNG